MKYAEIKAAWTKAQERVVIADFYATFSAETGLTKDVVQGHFADWNQMPHSEAIAIAERHGTTVRDGGFQAYLAEVTGQADQES